MTVLKHIKTLDTKQEGRKYMSYVHQNSYYYCYLRLNELSVASVLAVNIEVGNYFHP
jgi:hypothetical protein